MTGTQKGIVASTTAGTPLRASDITILDGVSSDALIFVKTRPHVLGYVRGSRLLYPGMQQEFFAIDVTADPCGDVHLARLSVDLLLSEIFLGDISLYQSSPLNPKQHLNLRSFNGNEQYITGDVINEVIPLDIRPLEGWPLNGPIPAGETRTYVLRADVLPLSDGGYAVSSRIASEGKESPEWTPTSSRSSRMLWSYSTEAGGQRWMTGAFLPELSTDYSPAFMPAGVLEDSPFYRLLRRIWLEMRPDQES